MQAYLGIDVGSVSTNLVVVDDNLNVLHSLYIRTKGQPIITLKRGMETLKKEMSPDIKISGVGTTGSARHLAGVMVGADAIKNEITTHAIAASHFVPGVRTVIEIGGQDSKIICIRDNVVTDFAMNTVCAAGTGSFLDQQASRLGIPIEKFGELALQAEGPVRIAGRCSVFAESDMIHKQQMGHTLPDIIAGLCEALARNYLNNVGKGKDIAAPIAFQGGVAANAGMRAAFTKALGMEVVIPEHFGVMGALGSAILAKEAVAEKGSTNFTGFGMTESEYRSQSKECNGCPNLCEVIEILKDKTPLARWGDRCGKWSNVIPSRDRAAESAS